MGRAWLVGSLVEFVIDSCDYVLLAGDGEGGEGSCMINSSILILPAQLGLVRTEGLAIQTSLGSE